MQFPVKVQNVTVTFGPLAVKKQNCMHFAEEHCFGWASALHDCANEYSSFSYLKKRRDYPTAHKTFTVRLKRYIHFR